MEEAQPGEARHGGELDPAFQALPPWPGSAQENRVVLTTVNTRFNPDRTG